jgi:hypothetical protein
VDRRAVLVTSPYAYQKASWLVPAHLSDEQRQRYANFAAAPSPDQLARYFHLDRSDRAITDGLRGDHNRLGFALMLGSARCIGAFPGADVEIPGAVTAFLGGQLGLKEIPSLKGYFELGGQRKRHLVLIRERYGFTEFADNGPCCWPFFSNRRPSWSRSNS